MSQELHFSKRGTSGRIRPPPRNNNRGGAALHRLLLHQQSADYQSTTRGPGCWLQRKRICLEVKNRWATT